MAQKILPDPIPQPGPWDLPIPVRQGLTSQGSEPHALGEALAVHLPAQDTQPDQPVEVGFSPIRTEGGEHQARPVIPPAEFATADGALVNALKEAPSEGQALK